MTATHSAIDRTTHIGPSAEDWAIMGAKATLTITTEISALSSGGDFMIKQDSRDIFSLDLLELTDTDPHKYNVGGEIGMLDLIGRSLIELPDAKEVYCYPAGNDPVFLVVFDKDRDDLSNLIAEVQMDMFETYPDAYFEVRYSISNRFSVDSLPKSAKRILERE